MGSDNKYRALAKDTLIFGIGNFGSKILSFLFVSLYTAYLTTTEYGIADLLTTTVSLLIPILTLCISEATLRFLFDKSISSDDVFSISVIILLISFIAASIFSCLINIFSENLGNYWLYFFLIFSLSAIDNVFSNIVKGIGKTSIFAIKGIIYTIGFIGTNIISLTLLGMGITGYFIAFVVAYGVSDIFMFIAGKMYKMIFSFKINKVLFHEMMKYSIPFIPAAVAWWINSFADKYMIVWLVGADQNGLYSVAQKIPTILTSITSIFTQAWQISAMQNYDTEEFSSYFSEILRMLCVLLIFGAGIVLIFNKVIATFLFQNEFFAAWRYVPLLTIAAIFSTLAGFLASAFTSAKKTKILFISTCIAAAVNMILNLILIPFLGAVGAAVATVISFFAMVLIRIFTMKSIVRLRIEWGRIGLSLLILFAASIVLIYLNSTLYIIFSIVICVIVIALNYNDVISIIKTTVKKFCR